MATDISTIDATTAREDHKPVHTILLDTSPILLNSPSISTLLANSHALVTTEAVLSEVKGKEARNRLDTLYRPFLTVRSPKLESVQLVREFARKTGDSGVLSATDFEILALAYDLECEKNGGDWRLRKTPGQKRLNGSPPQKQAASGTLDGDNTCNQESDGSVEQNMAAVTLDDAEQSTESAHDHTTSVCNEALIAVPASGGNAALEDDDANNEIDRKLETQLLAPAESVTALEATEESVSSESEDGWITPSNIKRHQAKDDAASSATRSEGKVLQVATMTGDFAMQNVLLQMNLNLLSTKTCKRVAHIKQMILRCHGCFATTKDMSKQFCPRCGQSTLTRVTCTTNDKGEVKLHLKANHQWNNRGNVFSIPKPTSGTANQKWKGPRQGGGNAGWGNDLILAEDQKEYIRAMSETKRTKNKDLMDDDVLPSILTGDRNRGGGRVKVGAGRNVNSRKR